MKKLNNFILLNNNDGNAFYNKWRKDTILSTFVVAPTFFIFYLVCTTLIFGVSFKLFFILLFPVGLIISGLVYSPYFLRRKYINYTIKAIFIKDGIISIETYNWFAYNSISISSEISNIEIEKSANQFFFKGEKVFLMTFKNLDSPPFYIIDSFFKNTDEFLNSL